MDRTHACLSRSSVIRFHGISFWSYGARAHSVQVFIGEQQVTNNQVDASLIGVGAYRFFF